MDLQLSQDQHKALDQIWAWVADKNRKQFITLGGYAGTGKTTLIAKFRRQVHARKATAKIAFCSYTGKATQVLKSKLAESKSIHKQDSVSTIHSLIYSPVTNTAAEIVGWEKKDKLDADMIIVDEASMIDSQIWQDLLSYKKPILAVGDHGQLPPISGNFNLMAKPDIKLENIHRQEAGNAIIEMSIQAREKGRVEIGRYGSGVAKLDKTDPETQELVGDILSSYNPDILILCGYNSTRVKLNNAIRASLEIYESEPQAGDRVICLRNNHKKQIFNGMLGTILNIHKEDGDWYSAEIVMDGGDKNYSGLVSAKQFNNNASLNFTDKRSQTVIGDLFDFGYAVTVHKAQGSQAKKVVLFEERFPKMDEAMWRRWLYTGITRAENELILIGE